MAQRTEIPRRGVRGTAAVKKARKPGEVSAINESDQSHRLFDLELSESKEVSALLSSFDGRLTEAERRIDRVLARLGIE